MTRTIEKDHHLVKPQSRRVKRSGFALRRRAIQISEVGPQPRPQPRRCARCASSLFSEVFPVPPDGYQEGLADEVLVDQGRRGKGSRTKRMMDVII